MFKPLVNEELTKAKAVKTWMPKESYIGYLNGFKEITNPNPGKVYEFTDSNDYGTVLETKSAFWGSANLDMYLSKMTPGTLVMIICNGVKLNPKSGRKYMDFTIQVSDKTLPTVVAASNDTPEWDD